MRQRTLANLIARDRGAPLLDPTDKTPEPRQVFKQAPKARFGRRERED